MTGTRSAAEAQRSEYGLQAVVRPLRRVPIFTIYSRWMNNTIARHYSTNST